MPVSRENKEVGLPKIAVLSEATNNNLEELDRSVSNNDHNELEDEDVTFTDDPKDTDYRETPLHKRIVKMTENVGFDTAAKDQPMRKRSVRFVHLAFPIKLCLLSFQIQKIFCLVEILVYFGFRTQIEKPCHRNFFHLDVNFLGLVLLINVYVLANVIR